MLKILLTLKTKEIRFKEKRG